MPPHAYSISGADMKILTVMILVLVTLSSAFARELTCKYDGRATDGPLFFLTLAPAANPNVYEVVYFNPEGNGMLGHHPAERRVLATDLQCIFAPSDPRVVDCQRETKVPGGTRKMAVRFSTKKHIATSVSPYYGEQTRETLKPTLASDLPEVDATFEDVRAFLEGGFDLKECEFKGDAPATTTTDRVDDR